MTQNPVLLIAERKPYLFPQLHTGARPTPEKFKAIRNRTLFNKPWGGLWTSTYDEQYGSGWVQWCLSESFSGPSFECHVLTPEPSVRVLVIETVADLMAAHKLYPADIPEPMQLQFPLQYLDFEAISKDFDGIHLTDAGQWNTRYSEEINLYGWDCESTLWFRWVFDDVTTLGARVFPERRDVDG